MRGGATWAVREARPEPRVERFQIPLPEKTIGAIFQLSPDGKVLAFTASETGRRHLWVRLIDSLAAQAVPGPLFTFAAYLGAVIGGWATAALCLIAVFLPSFLLVIGTLPFWQTIRRKPIARSAMRGVNAAVVGLLLAALYQPVWTAGVTNGMDFALAVVVFLLLFMWRTPPWLVVILSAAGAAALAAF